MKIKLYNTLTKKIEKFVPLESDYVRMYDCGPTVYNNAHVGNMWRFLISDFLRRLLEYNGNQVKQVMNITDVGHLTEDDLLAADTGEDKMIRAAKREKKTPRQIAQYYTEAFFKDRDRLNMLKPHLVPKATEHIQEMIDLIKILEKKGFTYWAGEKYFVFDISKFSNYGKLSGKNLKDLRQGTRLEPVPGKKNPFDFALWIKDKNHLMKWDSPWGVGYPGWHIECSAMSMKYLGETLDIHTGGEDNIFPHHENEIAQSEAATGKKFVRFWIHVRHNLVNGEKMSKSKGNFLIIKDLVDKGYDPLAFRYLCLTTHYRTNLNFTWESLESAFKALSKLKSITRQLIKTSQERSQLSDQKLSKIESFREDFMGNINNDLGIPQALAVVWEMLKSNISSYDKLDLLRDFDQVLGLKLAAVKPVKIPDEIKKLAEKRQRLRQQKKWNQADSLRQKINEKGFIIKDTIEGYIINKNSNLIK